MSAPVHITQEFLVLSRKSADHRANLHIVPKFGLVIPTFSSLSLWFMKPLLDHHHLSSNGSLSQRMSYISSHIHSKYPWILVSSLVMGISPIGESTYLYLIIDTDILLSIVILSSLYGSSKALARLSSSFFQWPFTYGSPSIQNVLHFFPYPPSILLELANRQNAPS